MQMDEGTMRFVRLFPHILCPNQDIIVFDLYIILTKCITNVRYVKL